MANQMLETLLEYRQQIENTGKVCKSDIIAIEEFLGDTVISEKVNLDKLTEVPSRVGADDVLETLNEKIDNVKALDVVPTATDIVEALMHLTRVSLNDFRELLDRILDTQSKLSTKIHEAMMDEKIIYRYNEANELIDITKLPVNEVYSKYKDYFKDVYTNLYGSDDGFILPEITNDTYNPSLAWNVLVSLISVNSISHAATLVPSMITVKDLASICEHAEELSETVELEAKTIYDGIKPDNNGNIEHYTFLHELAKKLKNEREVIRDEYSFSNPLEDLLVCMIKKNKTTNTESYPTED